LARKAVAATVASVLLFTALVVADSTIMVAQDNLASSALSAHIESRELVLSESLAGSASMEMLAQIQTYLASNPADCWSLPQYVASLTAAKSASGEDWVIAYAFNGTAAAAQVGLLQGSQGDNLSMVAPFSGHLPGALDIQANISIKEVGGGGSVSLERHEFHLLNLPISPDSASSVCALALGSLAAALRTSCNATSAQAAFNSVLPQLVVAAAARGFALTAGWGSNGAACSATYWVTLVEPGVRGATGSFDWTVRGSGATA
jgi:hypothetical protein